MELELKEQLFEGSKLSALELEQNLEAFAYKVFDNHDYRRRLTDEEKSELKTEISELSMDIKDNKNKLKELTTPIKAEIKELEGQREIAVTNLKKGSVDEKGRVYLMQDETTMTMHTYDRRGVRIGVRPLDPSERNLILKMPAPVEAKRTGTDN